METTDEHARRMLEEAEASLRKAKTYLATMSRVDDDLEEELVHEIDSVKVALKNASESLVDILHDAMSETFSSLAVQVYDLSELHAQLSKLYKWYA